MTNKENYQRTFSVLHASDCLMEVKTMSKRRLRYSPKLASALAAAVLMLSLSVAAYATDFAGIRTAIQLWRRGEQTDAVLELTENGYEVNFEGEDDQPHKIHGFVVKEGYYGEERPMTEEEIIEHLKMPDVEYRDDGSVWVYYEDQKVEITDQFDENNVCYISLKGSDRRIYLTIRYKDGYAYSEAKFPNADSFRTSKS